MTNNLAGKIDKRADLANKNRSILSKTPDGESLVSKTPSLNNRTPELDRTKSGELRMEENPLSSDSQEEEDPDLEFFSPQQKNR